MYKILKFDNCESCKNTWETFERVAHSTGFQSYSWIYNWQSLVGQYIEAKLQIIIVYSTMEEVYMIIPLMITKKRGIKILSWTSGDFSCGIFHKDFYNLFTRVAFIELWKSILKLLDDYDLIYFANQPEYIHDFKNPFVLFLNSYLSYAPSYQIILGDSYQRFESCLSKKLIQDTKRQKKRLQELGELKFVVASDDQEVEKFVKTMISMKSIKYKTTGINNIFENDAYSNFYTKFYLNEKDIIQKHVSALLLEEKIIAVHWGIVKHGVFYYIMPANDWDSYSKYSPGRILLFNLVEWSFEHNIKIFDFTVGGEDYKVQWSNGSTLMYNYLSYKNVIGFFGKIAYLIHTYLKKRKMYRLQSNA